ncbi:hypothetical protein FCV76_23860, partial [Vibrio sp. F13]
KAWGRLSSISGLTIRYCLLEEELQKDASSLREYTDLCDSYMRIPRDERPYSKLSAYIENTLSVEEIEHVRVLAERYSIARI